MVPKTQIFSLRHLPISLVFAYGIGGQDMNILPENLGIPHPSEYLFLLCKKSIPDAILIPRGH
ncbi:hypothetical protein [Cylindrospermum sp. FACHB-282]|uniref:hypothetical protein n=1 Tax=Cylindrospermum sp. FACHB-282 TaxID=2692794 RepID=UPI00168601B2|nr:hypothetical protein [Cylindrospermum sp. FACHB-282]MBD2386663.1 hypothetical protein [Cylindrospermum sp. FACHB-282]